MEYEYIKKELNLRQFTEETGFNPGLKTKGNKMWFIFEKPLSPEDKIKLDDGIENHIPKPIVKPTLTSAEEKLNQIKEILNK